MGNVKKLNEVKVGDTLYCLEYGIGNGKISIVELTVKELVNDGPHVKRHIYSREAIIIKEKVPNSPEPEGEYCIDQYYRGDECLTHSNGIYTTFLEAAEAANKELQGRFMYYFRVCLNLQQSSMSLLPNKILKSEHYVLRLQQHGD